jgi:hypothetical protein
VAPVQPACRRRGESSDEQRDGGYSARA